MSLKLTTDRELDEFEEMRYLSWTEEGALMKLFYRDDSAYTSYFPFAYNDKTLTERFVGYSGAMGNNDIEDHSLDGPFPKDVDIYICANSMKQGFKRTIDNLVNIQNLVIDIDYHEDKMSIDELNEHILEFEEKLLDKLVLKPNLINHTGRGMQLWFCIEPCYVALSKICLSVIDMLCSHIAEIMQELGETVLTIDKATSIKLNGLFRLPYTYNTKAKRWSECSIIHDEYPNVNDLRKKLLSCGYKSDYFVDYSGKTKKKSTKPKIKSGKYKFSDKINTNDYTPCLIHRKMFLEKVIESRGGKTGSRDLLMFALYATVIWLYDEDVAQAYCEDVNRTFAEPLEISKLWEIFRDVDRKRYKFTVKKFLDFINATEDERALYSMSRRKLQQKERQQKKAERNHKVKELYEQGFSIVAISKEINLSRPTIYKILATV
jgi:hypothetical protein